MIQLLRRSLLYSEKRVRDVLFRAVAEILSTARANGTAISLSRLTREAAVLGSQRGVQARIDSINWAMAAKAVLNTMLKAGVLLNSNGEVLVNGVGVQAAMVSGVRDGFERVSEAFLLEFLIRKLGDVSERDHKALAHALLRQFDPGVSMEELEDDLVSLLAQLTGSVEVNEEGSYMPLA